MPSANDLVYALHGQEPLTVDAAFALAETPEGRAELARSHGVAVGDYSACPDQECLICGVVACPHREPLHFHHDGCPACYYDQAGT